MSKDLFRNEKPDKKPEKRTVSSTVLPLKAQEEILEKLFTQMYISREDIDTITEKYGVTGDVETLQRSYRRQQAQRFISGLRDDNGVRLALSVKGGRFALIDYCNDRAGLNSLHERFQHTITGLKQSDSKVLERTEQLKRMIARFLGRPE